MHLLKPVFVTFLAFCLAGAGAVSQASADTFERITIPSQNLQIDAAIYRPDGPGPFPLVIALHGCGGLWNKSGKPSARHADWGERLAKQGFIVVLPDSFSSRGLGSQCGVSDRTVRASRERVSDAYAVKAWAQSRGDVKPRSISLLGWSNGGSTVLTSMRTDKAAKDGLPDFAVAIAFYPGCRGSYESGSYRLRVPTTILMGADDDWTPPGPCEGLVTAARARGEAMNIVLYPGAVHDFDHPNLEMRERTGLAFTAGGDGKAKTGTDPEARADALTRVPQLLAK